MRAVQGVFDEFAAALQYPYYFGENWAAFDECLGDLEWLGDRPAVVIIENATQVLADAPGDRNVFWDIVVGAASARMTIRERVLHLGPATLHMVLGGVTQVSDEMPFPVPRDASEWITLDDNGEVVG